MTQQARVIAQTATPTPIEYPKIQGEFLRELIGDRFVNIGFTFNQGSFLSVGKDDEQQRWQEFSVDPAAEGTNEHVLDQVRLIHLHRVQAATRLPASDGV
ncbi:erythromycin esterase family protein [Phytoactinopolyspora limicola]|uniref:erythromycin esterase family protein n=1 Tax=Phytoactinopolyspora limicola TaxID=2715536 RepID=UPI001A9C7A4D